MDDLFRVCFGRRFDMERWRWIHNNNPLGARATKGDIWIAEDKGRVVGYYSKIRYSMWYFGHTRLGTQSSSIATHPMYRNQGIATTLSHASHEDSLRIGACVAFALPNHMSYRIAIKNNYVSCGQTSHLVRVFDNKAYLRKRFGGITGDVLGLLGFFSPGDRHLGHSSGYKGIEYQVVRGFRADVGEIWESVKRDYDLAIERTDKYLEWRYNEKWGDYVVLSALKNGKTAGYAVYATSRSYGVLNMNVCEIISRDDDETTHSVLVDTLLSAAQRDGMAFISIYGSCSQGSLRVLSEMGFVTQDFGLFFGRRRRASPLVRAYDPSERGRLSGARYFYSSGDTDTA